MPPVGYICVLDFEATCNDKEPTPRPQKIIEFPSLMIDVRTGTVVSEFHLNIKPDVHLKLSDVCTELTSIPQDTVELTLESPYSKHLISIRHGWRVWEWFPASTPR